MLLAGDKTQTLVLNQWARGVTTANQTKLFVNGKWALFGDSLKLSAGGGVALGLLWGCFGVLGAFPRNILRSVWRRLVVGSD
jgi:hypothetical protein